MVEEDLGLRLSKPLLSWWRESVLGERESDSAIFTVYIPCKPDSFLFYVES